MSIDFRGFRLPARTPFAAWLIAAATALGSPCTHAQAPRSARVDVQGDAIVFEGRIDATAVARFIGLARDPAITRVVITSAGGIVDAAIDMADVIHDRQLDVDVPSVCLSSCANYVFPAGRNKHLGHARAVGWHGDMAHVLYLQQTGQASWSDAEMADARRLAAREAAFFQRIGVDGFVCWFAKIPPYSIDEFYALDADDMARFGIANVTIAAPQAGASDLAASIPAQTGNSGPTIVHVDWDRIERDRPAPTNAP